MSLAVNFLSTMLLIVAAFLSLAAPVSASTILSPGTVIGTTITPLNASYTSSFALDQSGLSAGYTSGVTDYDAYFAGNPTHVTSGLGTHFLSNSAAPGTIDFDLGAVTRLDGFAIWDWHNSQGGVGVTSVEVFSSTDAAFTTPVSLGVFGFNLVPTTAQTKAFTSQVNTQFIRLGLSGNGNLIGFGELAFEQAAVVPLPPAIWLFGSGLLGLVGMARRKKA